MQDRKNIDMAAIVEQGLARDLLHGSVIAWKFLANHNVPDDVILRVLREPALRRSTDAGAATGAARRLAAGHSAPPSEQPHP